MKKVTKVNLLCFFVTFSKIQRIYIIARLKSKNILDLHETTKNYQAGYE